MRRKPVAKTSLRRQAEERLGKGPSRKVPSNGRKPDTDPQRFAHELEVHRVELEMQNEELRHARVQLETALERYADFYDSAPAGYLVLKPDSTIGQANLTAASLLGTERSRLVRRRFAQFVAPNSRAAFSVLLARAFKSKTPESGELALAIKGQPPVTVKLQACASEDGRECRVVLTDITEHVVAAEALRESGEQFYNLFEHMFSGCILVEVLLDRNGNPVDHRLLRANSAFERMTGLKRNEELGRTSAQLSFQWPPEVAQTYYKVALSGEPLQLERFSESLQRYYDVRAFSPRRGQVALIFYDITASRQAREALRDSETKYRRLYQSMGEAHASVDMDGRLQEFNSMFLEMLGYTQAELRSMTYQDLTPAKWHEMEAEILRTQVLPREYSDLYEKEYRRKDGTILPVELRTFLVRDDAGRPASMWAIIRDISERKRAVTALRESEFLTRSVLNSLNAHIAVLDAQGVIVAVNEGWGRFARENGCADPAAYLGANYLAVCEESLQRGKDETVAAALRGLRSVLAGAQDEFSLEYSCHSPDEQRWFSLQATRFSGEGPVRLVVAHENITQRRLAEQARERSDEALRLAAGAARFGTYVYDFESGAGLWSPELKALLGLKPDDALRLDEDHVPLALHPEDRPEFLAAMMAANDPRRDGLLQLDFRIVRPDGLVCWLQADGLTTFAGDGEARHPERAAGVVLDITERKRADDALLSSQQWMTLHVRQTPLAVMEFSLHGRVLDWNPAAVATFGYSREEALGQHWTFIVPETIRGSLKGIWDTSVERLGSTRSTNENRTRDGRIITCDWVNTTLTDAHGKPIGVASLAMDITARQQGEEALRELSGRLLRAQDEERRRIARELHDTTAQGLAALLMNLSLVDESAPGITDKTRRLLTGAVALGEQCARELRALSYLLHPPMLDELGLAGAMRDYADGMARRSGLRIDLELPPDLERLPGETELAFFRVMQEAIANVRRHSDSRTASIRLARTATELRLEVRDQGRGMAAADKAPADHSPNGALGVGIAGMKERMRQLGGRLEMGSDDHGTCVLAIAPLPGITPAQPVT